MAQGKLKAKVKVPGKAGAKQKNDKKKNLGVKKGPKDLKVCEGRMVDISDDEHDI